MADRNGTRTVIAIEAARQHDGLAGHLDQFVLRGAMPTLLASRSAISSQVSIL